MAEWPQKELALQRLRLDKLKLTGSIPSWVSALVRLIVFSVPSNRLDGSIPNSIGAMRSLHEVEVHQNSLIGALPDAVEGLSGVYWFMCYANMLASSIPSSIGSFRPLETMSLRANCFTGTLPSAIARFPRLWWFVTAENKIAGSLPSVMPPNVGLLDVSYAELSGSLPEGLWRLSQCGDFYLPHNHLSGTLPAALVAMTTLQGFGVQGNALFGSLPPWFRHCRQLHWLLVGGSNTFAGQVPESLASLELAFLDVSSHGGPIGRFTGHLLSSASRMSTFKVLIAQHNAFYGRIPALQGTVNVLVMCGNEFDAMPDLHFGTALFSYPNLPKVLVHRNRLSCYPPRCSGLSPVVSLSGIGNNFMRPRRFPAWISPAEKVGLFWVSPNQGLVIFAKMTVAITVFLLLVRYRVCGKGRVSFWLTHHGVEGQQDVSLIAATRVLIWCLMQQCTVACMTWGLVINVIGTYKCPGVLDTLNIVVGWNHWLPHIISLFYWRSIVCLVWLPEWQCSAVAQHRTEIVPSKVGRVEKGWAWRACWSACWWMSWLLVVGVLSPLMCIQIAGLCVPGLFGLHEFELQCVNLGAGTMQAVINSKLLPSIAKLFKPNDIETLVGIGHVILSFLLPCLIALVLDDECMASWTRWWRPCQHPGPSSGLNVDFEVFDRKLNVLSDVNVCSKRTVFSAVACTKSIIRRLSGFVMSKLVAQAWLLPSLQFAMGRLQSKNRPVEMQVAMVIELAVLWGPVLPLALPLLCQRAFVINLTLALVAHMSGVTKVMSAGILRISIQLAVVLSVALNVSMAAAHGSVFCLACLFALEMAWCAPQISRAPHSVAHDPSLASRRPSLRRPSWPPIDGLPQTGM